LKRFNTNHRWCQNVRRTQSFFFKATGFSVEIADGTTALNGALQVLSSLCGFALEIVGDQNLTLKISLEHF
jgi:hypothetical protein